MRLGKKKPYLHKFTTLFHLNDLSISEVYPCITMNVPVETLDSIGVPVFYPVWLFQLYPLYSYANFLIFMIKI